MKTDVSCPVAQFPDTSQFLDPNEMGDKLQLRKEFSMPRQVYTLAILPSLPHFSQCTEEKYPDILRAVRYKVIGNADEPKCSYGSC